MARKIIDTGTEGNTATGDTIRTAMTKVNTNFEELYTDLAGTTSSGGILINPTTNGDVRIIANGTGIVEIDRLSLNNTTISSLDTNADITIVANGTGGIVLQGPVTAESVTTNAISSNGSNADISIQPSGTGSVIFGALKVNGTTISSDDSTQITIAENIQATGTLNVNGVTTLDGVSISDNIITSASSNANLELSAAGTGEVTTDTNLKLISGTPFLKIQRTDNANVPGIDFLGSAGTSGAKILFDGTSGTANELVFQTFTLLGGLAEVFRAQQGGAKVTGTLDIDGGVSITDNIITTSSSNTNLELTASGTGAVKVNAILSLPDGSSSDNYAGFGDDDDLKIFHNGSHSIIRETGTGSLYLQSDNNVIIGKDSSSETMIKGVADGAVELYHDNTKKFETTANGVSVVGTVTSTGATDLTLNTNAGTDSGSIVLKDGTNGDIVLTTDGTGDILLQAGGKVGIGSVNQPDTLLHLKDTNSVITLQRTNDANTPGLSFQNSGGNVRATIKMDGTSGTSKELVFQTDDGSLAERFRVTLSGAKVSGHLEVTGAQVDFTALPTSDPGVAGRLFRSGNDVKISTG